MPIPRCFRKFLIFISFKDSIDESELRHYEINGNEVFDESDSEDDPMLKKTIKTEDAREGKVCPNLPF